ncbi:SAF domain-containing protein [Aquiluna sp. KACHI24]|uniref:SAF domain-containing protein n=1 Tax=Aquiluna sp. KACHI24 TaxID=2968831 RepID=UPI0022076E97|nr:SAF domain-containing protein [Aquiluna sp. KACHI24]BDP99958.1 hypothetical protein AKACHI_02950 [Aquiluna sp. KACHI24]
MAIRMGRKIPNWLILAGAGVVVCVGLVVSVLAKPLPEYLVAAADIKPGSVLSEQDFVSVPLDLGEIQNYIRADQLPSNQSVVRVVRKGELLSAFDLTGELDPNFTALRLVPELRPAISKVGSFVSVWRALEGETGFEMQRLVERAEVLAIEEGEGLFADNVPEIEIRLGIEQSVFVMQAISQESSIFLVPVS